MARDNYLFTSESVSEGHPDKVCDRISDAVLDAFLAEEPEARVACETFATTGMVVIGGEVGLSDQDKLKNYMGRIGRDRARLHQGHRLRAGQVPLEHLPRAELPARAVRPYRPRRRCRRQQGRRRGRPGHHVRLRRDETPELMPAPIQYAHAILRVWPRCANRPGADAGPDAKSQLTLRYEGGKPVDVTSIVLSTQHLDEDMTSDDVRAVVEPYIREVLPEGWITEATEWWVNPTGKFVIGGPDGDAGLTGRKIIVDTYGGAAPHGGGAFSGKDPTKVDRSAAYAARYLAKNVVAAGLAKRCTIQLLCHRRGQPLSIYADTHGTGEVPEEVIEAASAKVMDLTPRGIRTHLQLNRPIYQRTAAYGHFGRAPEADGGFSWERTDLAAALKAAV
jgi:S-adenosylmethionine synthetase